MYKIVYKELQKKEKNKTYLFGSLHKNIGEKPNAVTNKQPHFIFSAENTNYPRKTDMSHESFLNLLKEKGYNADELYHADELEGKYGQKERSIIVHNPPKHSIKHFHDLAHALGQESSIYSDGNSHELHYHHGPNAGQHIKGRGTHFPKQEPEDFFSTTSDGTHFQHNLNFDQLYPQSQSMVKFKNKKIIKSEFYEKQGFYLCKNEDNHPLDSGDPETTLIHYSPTQNLKELDPEFHGVRGVGKEAQQGKPVHPMSFFYLNNTEPEKEVLTGCKSKYVTKLGDKKLYDIGKDKNNFWGKAKELANKRQINPGVERKEDFHNVIRQAGYHGVYNSSLNDTMRNVVGMFEKMPLHEEQPMHPNDFKIASKFNHHSHKERHDGAKNFAEETGHHNPNFLAKLSAKMNNGIKG